MRHLFILVVIVSFLISCERESETKCPVFWDFDRNQISADAQIDSGELVLEVWNPETPNGILLSQTPLEGDFEISISLKDMSWDTLLSPQFRMEVVTESGFGETVSGVAVSKNAFYCYVGNDDPQNGDMRLMNELTGTIEISRLADTARCVGQIGGVLLEYSDVLNSGDATVRLVFGSTSAGAGRIGVRLDDFRIKTELSGIEENNSIFDDDFSCRTW